jgi:uncharacterized LabA/DUF88 family protein
VIVRRTAFLVDGFNLYHSLKSARRALGGRGTLWLDLRALCASFLHSIGGQAGISDLYYFSALATHVEGLKPGAAARHLAYLEAIRSTGIIVELGQFKGKRLDCPACRTGCVRHEEKETDVAIAVRLMELILRNRRDAAVVVSAHSDLAPALREAGRLAPDKPSFCCFPYGRGSFDLRRHARASFRFRKEQYVRRQLPDPVPLADGRRIHKPPEW